MLIGVLYMPVHNISQSIQVNTRYLREYYRDWKWLSSKNSRVISIWNSQPAFCPHLSCTSWPALLPYSITHNTLLLMWNPPDSFSLVCTRSIHWKYPPLSQLTQILMCSFQWMLGHEELSCVLIRLARLSPSNHFPWSMSILWLCLSHDRIAVSCHPHPDCHHRRLVLYEIGSPLVHCCRLTSNFSACTWRK